MSPQRLHYFSSLILVFYLWQFADLVWFWLSFCSDPSWFLSRRGNGSAAGHVSHPKSQFLVAWLGGGEQAAFSLPPTALSTNTQPPILSESFRHTPRGTTGAPLTAPLGCFLLTPFTRRVGNGLNVCVFPKLTKSLPACPWWGNTSDRASSPSFINCSVANFYHLIIQYSINLH